MKKGEIMIDTLVMIGCHGSGKTTLGKLIAHQLGWDFCEEIGAKLRRSLQEKDAHQHAAVPNPDFERAVIQSEIERDKGHTYPRVIETWHPGNLAYARMRSPNEYAALETFVINAIQPYLDRTLVIPLYIPFEEFKPRIHEPGPRNNMFYSFLYQIQDDSLLMAQNLGLPFVPQIDTSQDTITQCAAKAIQFLCNNVSLAKNHLHTVE